MTQRILVTGATGNIGTQVAEQLLARGATVRVAVRDPERASALAARGAEVVRLDWDDPETYGPAFDGVSRAFLLTPFVEHIVGYVEHAVAAAKAAGVGHIVRMSAIGADPEAPGVGREHGQAEQRVKDSGIGWTVLQPTFFADNLVTYQRATLLSDGAWYGASHGGRVAYVATSDIAEVAAAVLLAPEAHLGQTYVLTGPEALTDAELTEALSAVAGRPLSYVDLDAEQLGGGLRAAGTPEWMVDHLLFFEDVKAKGWGAQATGAVRQVLGRDPLPVREGLKRYADVF